MLAARLGAWLRKTGERWAKAVFAEKLAVLLGAGRCPVYYCDRRGRSCAIRPVRGRPWLRSRLRGWPPVPCVRAVLFLPGDVRRPDQRGRLCGRHRRGNPHAGRTARYRDAFADRTTATPVQRLRIRRTACAPSMMPDGGYRVFRAEDRLHYLRAGVGHAAGLSAFGLIRFAGRGAVQLYECRGLAAASGHGPPAGRSHCPQCTHAGCTGLSACFQAGCFLRRRCRHRAHIPARYFLVEVLGVLALGCTRRFRHRAQPDAGAVRHELGGAHRHWRSAAFAERVSLIDAETQTILTGGIWRWRSAAR